MATGLSLPLRLWAAKKPASAGITFPITGVTSAVSSTRSPSFTLGTAPLENDVLVFHDNNGSATVVVTDPSGWVNVLGANTQVSSDSHSACMLYHIVTAGEAGSSTVTWTLTNLWDAANNNRPCVAVLRGVDTASPLSGSAASGFSSSNAATPWVIPSVTPSHNGARVVAGVGGDGGQTQTTPGGWSLVAGSGTTLGCYMYSYDTLGTASSPTGTTNVTPSSGDEYIAIAASFKPA